VGSSFALLRWRVSDALIPPAVLALRPGTVTGCVLCAVLASACATLPDAPVQRALYVDLRKAVELSDDTGWVVDRVQLEANAEDAMRSACQVAPAERDDLDAWISGQLALGGGSAAELYRKHDRDLGAAKDALGLERTRSLLRFAQAHAGEDCPFWLEPDEDFRGVQTDDDRFVLLAETLGFGAVILEDGEAGLGGGGGGRLLLARGLGPRLTVGLGGEVGGIGAFVEDEDGARGIETTFTAGVPLLLRISSFARIFDFEVAARFRVDPGDSLPPPGVRVSFGGGISTMRSSAFMPYGLLWLGYEYHPAFRDDPADHSMLIGTRVGVDWGP
jgi:hypothetical protein